MTDIVIVTELKEIEEAVKKFIKDHRTPVAAAIKGIDAEISELHAKSRDKTYDLVAELVTLAESLGVEEPTPGYLSFLVSRAFNKPSANHNPYMVFIKAVFAEKMNGVWVFGDKHRSYEKHANHVRFLVAAKRKGLITGTIQDFIRDYPEKLKGIEAQDRKDHPNAAQAKRVEKARDLGRRAASRGTIQETFKGQNGDLMKVYGRVVNGTLELLAGKVVANDAEKESIYYYIGSVKE